MAFTHEGNRGTANDKVAGTSLAVAVSADIPVGAVVGVWVAWDSANTTSGVGSDQRVMRCVDDQGNIWQQMAFSYPSSSSVGLRVNADLFLCKVRTQINSGDSITLEWNLNVVAKAMSVEEFSHDGEEAFAVAGYFLTAASTVLNVAADPGAITPGVTLTSRSWSYFHVLAGEGPDTDAYTWDADYTQITGDGTTGGADDSNVHVRGGFRLNFTSTTDTVDVASDTADRDYMQGMIALCEIEKGPLSPATGTLNFPNYGVLDDMNRADEDPLFFGGLWRGTPAVGLGVVPGGSTPTVLELLSNGAVVTDRTHDDNYGGQYWNDDIICNNFEAYVTCTQIPDDESHAQSVPLPPTNPGVRGFGVIIGGDRPSGLGPSNKSAGWFRGTTRAGGHPWDEIIFGLLNGLLSVPFKVHGPVMANGVKIGMAKADDWLHLWLDEGSGWEWVAAIDYGSSLWPGNWPQSKNFHMIGAWASGARSGSVTKIDDFGGGNDCFRPQIYRRLRA